MKILKQINFKNTLKLLFLLMTTLEPIYYATESIQTKKEDQFMKMRITSEDTVLTATMYENTTSQDFLSLLPLTLKMTDYASTEKVSDIPKKLSTQGAPAGCKGNIGDITLYAPWGNMAIFYKDFGYASGLVCMGKIDASHNEIKKLAGNVLFELIN